MYTIRCIRPGSTKTIGAGIFATEQDAKKRVAELLKVLPVWHYMIIPYGGKRD